MMENSNFDPMCIGCLHINTWEDIPRCNAFPDGIPIDILTGKVEHLEAYEGDHGFRFEPIFGSSR